MHIGALMPGLSHTLQVASKRHAIYWILVEDAERRNPTITALLARSGLPHAHLNKKEKHIAHHFKGGDPRNEGIRHIRAMVPPPHPDSVVYFAGAGSHEYACKRVCYEGL